MGWKGYSPPFPFMCIPDVGGLGSWVWVGQEGKDLDSPLLGGKCGNTLMSSTILHSDGEENHCCCCGGGRGRSLICSLKCNDVFSVPRRGRSLICSQKLNVPIPEA